HNARSAAHILRSIERENTCMDLLSNILTTLAPQIHFIAFGLLILSGLNFPISEDLVFILSAAISVTYAPDNLYFAYAGCIMGAYTSDFIAYALGRFAGRKLFTTPFFKKLLPEEKLHKMEFYFMKYGAKTVLFGRFIPFGVRNIIFISAGFSKMRFPRFMVADIIPLSITSSLLFYLGYRFGEHYRDILPYLDRYKIVLFGLFLTAILFILLKRYISRRSFRKSTETT
ncbi:MAG TPA: DedA family protein, partial [Spirochaetota bacterium]|nr:DedA family protein [Spirochaetota bacterium]